ncbi:MAG: aconitate hydratase AcnA [Desulfobacterales bacterium]|jgi:aconitate hydratase|nr:aconitate hydratase AcnA [Desulfobacterales bacterium]
MNKADFTRKLSVNGKSYTIYDINRLGEQGIADVRRLPYSIKILVENLLRKLDDKVVLVEDLKQIANWQKTYAAPVEIPYHPARVLMQDFTGVPAVVDLAAMRDAVKALGGDPKKINPLVPVELIVDHSVQVDYFGTADALKKNVELEYQRNTERYQLLKWAQKSFDNFRVVPPNSGICHQVNLEHLGRVMMTEKGAGGEVAFPDTVVGTDSHTPMINGIGVMGWGVGGIEAEAVMLGQPYYMSIPEVIGVRLVGALQEGVTATDLVLTITEMLRTHNVVEKFVEYFGPGMKHLTVTDRATIANMTPEYGATLGFFPVDEKTIAYLRATNRAEAAAVTEAAAKALGLFYTDAVEADYSVVLELDISTVAPSVAGPARPQDRVLLKDLKSSVNDLLGCSYERNTDVTQASTFHDESGSLTTRAAECRPAVGKAVRLQLYDKEVEIGDASIVIAAITSCTNTSNPFVMLGAGLVAKKAVARGLRVPAYVKTSLAPGSRVVERYLKDAGLIPYLDALGFHVAGFGCMTCIGNSGPLHPLIDQAITDHGLTVAAVLSGNRNFEARIHQKIRGNYLASPMLVVAFAIAGRIDVDLTTAPVGIDPNGEPVYLKDIWPSSTEINALIARHVKPEFYADEYAAVFDGDEFWRTLPVAKGVTYAWEESSTYIKNPPYFEGLSKTPIPPTNVSGARALATLGDSVTTDHISPAGAIPENYPAGLYLKERGVAPPDFNSYGARRGNHEVMMRGTFGNIRIKNKMVGEKEGSFTIKFPEAEQTYIYDAAMAYKKDRVPLVVLGGKEYGTGSSRDWAAKGTDLLGIRAVIAESYERIHRSNLVGMGVLPLMFQPGDSWRSLGLDGSETIDIQGIDGMMPRKVLSVTATKADGKAVSFDVVARLNTDVDVAYFEHGGILPYVLRKLMEN